MVVCDGQTYIICDEALVNFTSYDSTEIADISDSFHGTNQEGFLSYYIADNYSLCKNEQQIIRSWVLATFVQKPCLAKS